MPYKDPELKKKWEQGHRSQRIARRRELRKIEAARVTAQPRTPKAHGAYILLPLVVGGALAAYNPKLAMGAGGLTLLVAVRYKKDWRWWLVGALVLLTLQLLIILSAMLIALRCRHQYGRLLALGIATNMFMYVFVNVAMVEGAIPVGGVPMPLVSHGGSAMLTVMVAMGLLLSVHVHRDVEFDDKREEF